MTSDAKERECLDEKDAVLRLKTGDITGLEVLVKQYQIKAIRTAYLITQDKALAEDIVQDAFVRVYHRIEQYDSNRPFSPWFMRIVANDAVKAIRRGHRQVSLDASLTENDDATFLEFLVDSAPHPDERVEQGELKQVVRDALQQLSPEQRKVVVLRYYLGMNEREMSDELDIPKGTVKWRLSAARKILRGVLPRVFIKQTSIG